MVTTAKTAVTPSNRKGMEEVSPEYTSLVNVHDEGDEYVAVRKGRSKSHQRDTSLFSNASAPVDLSDYPSMRRAPSSKAESVLRKSISGNLNWKFGELWSKFRGSSAKPNDSSLTANTASEAATQTVAAVEVETIGAESLRAETLGAKTLGAEALGFQNRDERKPPSSRKEWKKEKDQVEVVSPTSRSKSLHFTSLGLFSSSKFSGSDDLDASASPLERSGQLESSAESTSNQLSGKWRDIQGVNNWNGLMDPMDIDLRKEILRYGDFAQLAYDNFECNAHSKFAGSARHSKQEVLRKLNKQSCGFEVTRFLYATSERPLPGVLQSSLSSKPWDKDSNWMGYVAVASDPEEIERLGRRDIVVAWRGAVNTVEWLVDAQTQMTAVAVGNSKVGETVQHCPRVEKGFWSLYTCKRPASLFNRKSASEQVITELRRLLTLYKGETLSVTLTGHNLGGVLAVLTAYEIAERGLLHKPGDTSTVATPVTAFTFGAPHVGDGAFRRRCEELQLKVLRVVNVHDVVPKSIANLYPLWGSSDASKHVGVELQVNHKLSPYLKSSLKDPLDWHNLECYLHLVDGYRGVKVKGFELVTRRDVALVNKYVDVLQERFCIPGRWWQAENKGLVMSRQGRWVEADRALQDIPSLANLENFL